MSPGCGDRGQATEARAGRSCTSFLTEERSELLKAHESAKFFPLYRKLLKFLSDFYLSLDMHIYLDSRERDFSHFCHYSYYISNLQYQKTLSPEELEKALG